MNENNASASDHGVCYTGYSRRSPVAPWRKYHPVCSTWTNCPREQQYVAPRKWRARVARFGYPPGQFPSLQYDRRGSHARHFDLCHGTGRSSGYRTAQTAMRTETCKPLGVFIAVHITNGSGGFTTSHSGIDNSDGIHRW